MMQANGDLSKWYLNQFMYIFIEKRVKISIKYQSFCFDVNEVITNADARCIREPRFLVIIKADALAPSSSAGTYTKFICKGQ